MPTKVNWVDYGKGIGILLVVYGHLTSSAYNANISINTDFFQFSDSIVYSFHMPLFFLLSGLFVEQSLARYDLKDFLLDKIKVIAYPYLIWSVFQSVVELMFSSHSHYGITLMDIILIPIKPWGQFWFLYALLLMFVVHGLLRKYPFALIALAIGLFFLPIKTDYIALNGFSHGFLFFMAGSVLKTTIFKVADKHASIWKVCVAWLVFFTSAFIVFSSAIPLTRLTMGGYNFYFILLAAMGIFATVILSSFLAKNGYLGFLKVIGRYSMEVYLVHLLAGVATRIILVRLFQITDPVMHIVLGVLVGVVAPIVIYKLSVKLRFPYLFQLKLPVSAG